MSLRNMGLCLLGLALMIGLIQPLQAQDATHPTNGISIDDPDIRTVQLHLAGAPLTMPFVDLKAPTKSLVLEFDHLGPDIKDYSYTIVHCNSDWLPSELDDNEYIDGFTEDRLTTVQNSRNTLMQYTHYTLELPNANMRWTRSGNYLLKIFDNDNDKALVVVRRFCVVEPLWRFETDFTSAALASKTDTHHELDFIVTHKGMRIPMPQNDVKAYVLQNGRWDNMIGPLRPQFLRNEQLVFDFQDKIAFPAGKEWRFFDIRTFDFKGDNVATIVEQDTYYEVTLRADRSRAGHPYQYFGDLNGRFSIENRNINQTLDQCEYAKVLFHLERPFPEEDADVYVFGELSDWQLKPEFKMEYNYAAKAYYCEAMLKQGYYNYQYAVLKNGEQHIDEEGFEGNWYETGNQYSILVYFRTFGDRYERLMGVVSVNNRQ